MLIEGELKIENREQFSLSTKFLQRCFGKVLFLTWAASHGWCITDTGREDALNLASVMEYESSNEKCVGHLSQNGPKYIKSAL